MIFYTYLWLREDGTPYYVGKGTGSRAYRKGCPPVERILLQDWPSELDAFEAEKFLISFYGRKDLRTGPLWNMTDGGDAPPSQIGRKRTKEYRARISATLKRKGIKPPSRRGIPLSLSSIKLRTKSRAGYRHSTTTIEKMRRAAILRYS